MAAAFAAMALGYAAPALRADPIEDFYRGKDVTIVLGYGPGGGYDAYLRLISRHLGRFIPGKPNVNVQYMPGASSLTAANYVFNIAPQDGTIIAAVSATLPFAPLLDPTAAKFDPTLAQWLPSPSSSLAVTLIWNTIPVTTIEQARQREVIMGTGASNGMASFFGRMLNALLGTKFKLVTGYQAGSAESLLAMERGESEGFPSMPWTSLKASKPDWIRDHKVNIILQYGKQPSPELAGVPFLGDLVKSGDDRLLYEIGMGPLDLGVPYMLGPSVPAERTAALRAAFVATYRDPALRAEAQKLNLDIDDAPLTGEEAAAIVAKSYAAPKALIDRLKVLYNGEAR
jgi:tripartite-type tricarboxylate transporter receptor subunit TctC